MLVKVAKALNTYNGLNLTCNYCLIPCFFDCIENEINLLLSSLNIDFVNIDVVSKYDKMKENVF